jgi:hypothetical protein
VIYISSKQLVPSKQESLTVRIDGQSSGEVAEHAHGSERDAEEVEHGEGIVNDEAEDEHRHDHGLVSEGKAVDDVRRGSGLRVIET